MDVPSQDVTVRALAVRHADPTAFPPRVIEYLGHGEQRFSLTGGGEDLAAPFTLTGPIPSSPLTGTVQLAADYGQRPRARWRSAW